MREYFTLPQKQIHKLNKNLAWEEAILTEPFTIGANATLRGNVGAGDRVVVFGAGPIGISILKLAKIKGATVMITDLVDDKLEYAKKNGADVIVNTSKVKLEDAVNEWTKGEGANKVIDAVCIPKMLEVGLDILSVAGTFVNLSFGAAPAQIPGLPITKKQLTIAGSRLQSYQFENVIRLMEAKKLQGDGLVTNIWDFVDIQKAFDTIDEDPTKIRKGLLKFF
jgi:L-gulonate 5-dehydrogenase